MNPSPSPPPTVLTSPVLWRSCAGHHSCHTAVTPWLESVFHTYFFFPLALTFFLALLPVVFADAWRSLCPIYNWAFTSRLFFCGHEHSYLEGNMTGVFCSLKKTQVASPLSHRVLTVFRTKCESLLWSKPHVQSESRLGISWNRLASMAPVGSSCLATQYSCTQGPHLSKIWLKLLPSILNSIWCRGGDCWVFIAAFVSFWNVDLPSDAKKLH